MKKPETVSYGLISFSSIEIVKACIFYASGRMNLRKNDIISSGVNFYYGAFHNCISILALSPDGEFLEEGIIEWKDRSSAPKWYMPCSHGKLITKIKKVDQNFARILTELKEIREYLSYGPYVCSDPTPHWKPFLFTCEIEGIKQKLKSYDSYLSDMLHRTPEIVNSSLAENQQKFAFCFWGNNAITIFNGELIFNNLLYDECKRLWSRIGKSICPKMDFK